MSSEDLTGQVARQLVTIEPALRTVARRWLIVGLGIIVTVGLHSAVGDPRLAWLSLPIVAIAGLAGGSSFGLLAGFVAGAGHGGVDLALGVEGAEVVGIFVRLLVLAASGVIGAVVSRFQEERDAATFRQATEDAITGLLNVRAFYEELGRLREQQRPYAILIADIAGMRDLNERYGHPTGTEALRALGHVLQRYTKGEDLVARLGSDEIAVALVDTDEQGALAAARRLSTQLADEPITLPDGERFEVHAYYGVAAYPVHADDEVSLLREADAAVEDAKLRGPGEIGQAGD